MSALTWCSRRVGALSMMALIALCYWVISKERRDAQPNYATTNRPHLLGTKSGAGIWAPVLAYYSLLIHALVFLFPARACWSLWTITRSLRRAVQSKAIEDYKKCRFRRRVSLTSVSSQDTLTTGTLTVESNTCSPVISDASDSELDNYTEDTEISEDPLIHAIVVPNYKEEVDTLRETLDVLASHSQARTTYHVSSAAYRDALLLEHPWSAEDYARSAWFPSRTNALANNGNGRLTHFLTAGIPRNGTARG